MSAVNKIILPARAHCCELGSGHAVTPDVATVPRNARPTNGSLESSTQTTSILSGMRKMLDAVARTFGGTNSARSDDIAGKMTPHVPSNTQKSAATSAHFRPAARAPPSAAGQLALLPFSTALAEYDTSALPKSAAPPVASAPLAAAAGGVRSRFVPYAKIELQRYQGGRVRL